MLLQVTICRTASPTQATFEARSTMVIHCVNMTVNQTCGAFEHSCATLSPFHVYDTSYANMLMSILWAVLIGAVIGLQREYRYDTNRCLRQNGLLPYSAPWSRQSKRINAGLRTYILVSVGACLFTLNSQHGFTVDAPYSVIGPYGDPARVAAQIVSGIGFLGAGAILKSNNHISGLTTAASLWITAALGMACGSINHQSVHKEQNYIALTGKRGNAACMPGFVSWTSSNHTRHFEFLNV